MNLRFKASQRDVNPYALAPLLPQILQRATLHGLKVTSCAARAGEIPGIVLCPYLCWAAELHEFEQVEVYNIRTGTAFRGPVLYGERERVVVSPAYRFHVRIGDGVIISAYATVSANTADESSAVVAYAPANRVTEICRIRARRVKREPSYVPLDSWCAEVVNGVRLKDVLYGKI